MNPLGSSPVRLVVGWSSVMDGGRTDRRGARGANTAGGCAGRCVQRARSHALTPEALLKSEDP